MAQINKITLRNYKSLQNVEIALNPLNILIGRNGSGKSNLVNFFRLLCHASNEQLASEISRLGGFSEIRSRGSGEREGIEWELELAGLDHVIQARQGDPVYYTGQLAAQGNSFTVKFEEIAQDPFPGHSERYKYLSATNGRVRILKSRTGDETKDIDYVYKDQELIVSQIRDPMSYPLLDEIRRLLKDWTIFRGFGENALENIYKSQPVNALYPMRLDPEGENLISVLQDLDNEGRYSQAYDSLNEILSIAFPDFEKLDIKPVAENRFELRWRSSDFPGKPAFPARSMSDGMLRFIGLATLLLLPDPPALIAIDEPEIGLHHSLIPLLGGLLKQASERTQVIVTTHSPLLLSSEDIELSDVVLVERAEGSTIIERADSRANLDRWLERYELGELWTMGKLGG
ncbi:MAG TPA: AAA family ATPase [Aggregatilineaceae bacterium]|nr:AAA family ATPase [Aggregatilineaceae bacterium]